MYHSFFHLDCFSNKRDIFRSRSEHDVLDAEEGEVIQQGAFLGDSLFQVMSGSDTITPEEEILLRECLLCPSAWRETFKTAFEGS